MERVKFLVVPKFLAEENSEFIRKNSAPIELPLQEILKILSMLQKKT